MSGKLPFELHPAAASDITEIWEFIAQNNLVAAQRVREDILNAIRGLVSYPNQGHQRKDLAFSRLRFHTVRDYVIVYVPDATPLLVLAVLHGARNPRVLAAILRERWK
jgi:toxin ParE1/3/4